MNAYIVPQRVVYLWPDTVVGAGTWQQAKQEIIAVMVFLVGLTGGEEVPEMSSPPTV